MWTGTIYAFRNRYPISERTTFISRTIGNSSRRIRKIAKCRISTVRSYIELSGITKLATESWYGRLISGRDCSLRSVQAYKVAAICSESPIAIGGPALNGSLAMHLPPAVRERTVTKWFSHCSSSSLRGSLCGTSSSSQNLRTKMLVPQSAMQSDTWASSRSGWAAPAGPERIQPKTVFWAAGASARSKRGGSRTSIDANSFDPISMWIGCWLDGSGSASSISRRWGQISRDWVRGAVYAVMLGSTYAVSEIIGTDLSRGDICPSEILVLTPPLSIPATPLIVTSMRCRLVRSVWQRLTLGNKAKRRTLIHERANWNPAIFRSVKIDPCRTRQNSAVLPRNLRLRSLNVGNHVTSHSGGGTDCDSGSPVPDSCFPILRVVRLSSGCKRVWCVRRQLAHRDSLEHFCAKWFNRRQLKQNSLFQSKSTALLDWITTEISHKISLC